MVHLGGTRSSQPQNQGTFSKSFPRTTSWSCNRPAAYTLLKPLDSVTSPHMSIFYHYFFSGAGSHWSNYPKHMGIFSSHHERLTPSQGYFEGLWALLASPFRRLPWPAAPREPLLPLWTTGARRGTRVWATQGTKRLKGAKRNMVKLERERGLVHFCCGHGLNFNWTRNTRDARGAIRAR